MAEQNPPTDEHQPPEGTAEPSAAPEAAAADATAPGANQDAKAEPTPEEAIDAANRAAEDIKRETGYGSENADADGDSTTQAGTASVDESPQSDETSESEKDGEPLNLENFEKPPGDDDASAAGLNLLDDIDLNVTVELGRTRMYIEDVLRLNEHSVVELDKAAGDSVDIYVNDRLVARGEVLVLNENFCVRINEIISQQALDECDAGNVIENAS